MTILPDSLKSRPLSHLSIPGSHDSGSYDLKLWSKVRWDTMKNPQMKTPWHGTVSWHRFIPVVSRPLVRRWGMTQLYSTHSQLQHGIRYFDIRVAQKSPHGNFYFIHGLYGPPISHIASDINTFLEKHTEEVVIFHVQHIFNLSATRQRSFLDLLVSIFGLKICPYTQVNQRQIDDSSSPVPSMSSATPVMTSSMPSLQQLICKQRQILIFFPQETPIQSDLLWPNEMLANPWANTTSTVQLIRFLDDNVSSRSPHHLYVTQGILTPNFTMSRIKAVSTLKKQLSMPCNRVMSGWIKQQKGSFPGPNIIMTDFVEYNHYEIPRLVVSLNYPDLPFPEVTPFASQTETRSLLRANAATARKAVLRHSQLEIKHEQ